MMASFLDMLLISTHDYRGYRGPRSYRSHRGDCPLTTSTCLRRCLLAGAAVEAVVEAHGGGPTVILPSGPMLLPSGCGTAGG